MIKRPDEVAVDSEIERDQQFRNNLIKGAGTAASLGAGAIATGTAARVLPWLSQYIPTDLAMKGLRKVSPKIADFLKRGQSAGLDIKEGLQYVKDSISKEQEKKPSEREKKPKIDRNIIEQYSPELHQFIMSEIKNGRSPLEAGAIAALDRKGSNFKSIISKLTKDHKSPWSAILETVYGGQQGPQNSSSAQQQQPNQSSQSGPGQQALMDILAKINQKLGQ